MLQIKNLHATAEGKEILRGIDLEVNIGEVHAIMGPNGSGKSTLAQVLAGRDLYQVTGGEVTYEGKDLLAMSPEERAREGIFLAFQYPVEIPGVNNTYFLRSVLADGIERRAQKIRVVVPGGDPRRQQHVFSALGAQCHPQAPRAARI